MRICTVQFSRGESQDYAELLEVYKKSLAKAMPNVPLDEIILDPQTKDMTRNWVFTSNTLKLRAWVDYLERASEPVVFTDCDMLALGDISCAFTENQDFDIAVTGIDRPHNPINGGVVFVRPNARSRAFFRAWVEANERLYKNPILHNHYIEKWLGMNQAAFGYLMDNGHPVCNLMTLPLNRYNACDSSWGCIDHSTLMLHIKGALRTAVLKRFKPVGPMANAMRIWYAHAGITEAECKILGPRAANKYP
jgi:hypothetical protein